MFYLDLFPKFNLFFFKISENGEVKLYFFPKEIDFASHYHCGVVIHWAPEIYDGSVTKINNRESAVYSFGIIMWEILNTC